MDGCTGGEGSDMATSLPAVIFTPAPCNVRIA
jgi:hypothetical protein